MDRATLIVDEKYKIKYSDGKDYSNLEANSLGVYWDEPGFIEHGLYRECQMCGSTNITIKDKVDICHDCGFVYT